MNNNNDKFIKVSYELLDMIDETKEYELQLAMTLIYLTKNNYEWYSDSFVYTTPSMLIKQFGNYKNINDKPMERQRPKIIDALLDLRDRGLIAFITEKAKPSFKEELLINTKALLDLANKEPFAKLNVEHFFNTMQDGNSIIVNNEPIQKNAVESYLLWFLLNIQSEWNADNMKTLKEYEGEVTRYIGNEQTDNELTTNKLSELTFVFTCSSVDVLRGRRYNKVEFSNNLCGDDYAYAYINKLIELGCIKVIKRRVKTNDGWRDMNFYYSPIFKHDDMLAMVKQWAKRKRYAIKQRENKQQPKQEQEQQTEPKPFGIPRGGEREPSNCIPLTEIEASHTSDAYRKVSEKVKARNWNDTIEHIETTGKEIEFDLTDLYIQPKCSERVNRDKRW